ncbi:MAG: Bug family tripartite tricarboxylate transporter substrate binding protein [Beijerinckiaceae bacterium]
MRRRAARLCVLAAFSAASLICPALAQDKGAAEFFKGRNVSVFIGFGPGGGYDMSARTLARHMGRHIPGEPSLVPRNMPGAGSLQLANYLYTVAPKDGSEFGVFGRTVPLDPLMGTKGANYDPRQFTWLGSTSNEVSTCVSWNTSPVKTFEDVRKHELSVGAAGPTSPSATFPNILNGVLGTKFKVIAGYTGSAAILTAMESGELSGFCSWGWVPMMAQRPDWVRDRKVNVFVQLGLRKHPDHPGVPLALDFARSNEERDVLEFVFAPQVFARPFAAPPKLAPERAATLRQAFSATVKDPAFVAEAEKLGLEPELVTWEEMEKLIDGFYKAPPAIVARAREAMTGK